MTTINDDKNALPALREKYESLKQECFFRLANLEEETRRIRKKASALRQEHDAVVERLLPEQKNKWCVPESSRNLTAFPLPEEILKQLDEEPINVVDVGAFELEGQDDLYADLFPAYPSNVYGFEPQNDTIVFETVKKCKKMVFPWAIGDGKRTRFYKTTYKAASSTLEPDHNFLSQFLSLPTMLEVESQGEFETKKLDDIQEISDCDLLKIDVQGGELKVLQGSLKLLERTPIIMTEVEFAPVYKKQPLFADIDSFLRAEGFFLLDLYNKSHASFSASLFGDLKSRLMWADAIYIKEPQLLCRLGIKKIIKTLVVAHLVLHDSSLSCLLLDIYDKEKNSAFLKA